MLQVRLILTAPWFHGFLTSREAELLLEDQPPGTFLIRFSRSSGGSFALAFVQKPRKILHILSTATLFLVIAVRISVLIVELSVQSRMPRGFKIEEEESENAKYFISLHEIVDHYSVFLQKPFTSELPRER